MKITEKMDPREIDERLVEMIRMQRNAEARALGLNIGDFDETFERNFIEGREFDMFFLGIPGIGLGYGGQWIVDVTKIPRQMNFKEAPESDDDYIHPFCTLLDYIVIEELIHTVVGITHDDFSRDDFMAFVSTAIEREYITGDDHQ